MNYQGVVKDNS